MRSSVSPCSYRVTRCLFLCLVIACTAFHPLTMISLFHVAQCEMHEMCLDYVESDLLKNFGFCLGRRALSIDIKILYLSYSSLCWVISMNPFGSNITWGSLFLLPSKSYSDVYMCELQFRNSLWLFQKWFIPLVVSEMSYFFKIKFYFGVVLTALEWKQQNIFRESWI